jgi:hypothetical protein
MSHIADVLVGYSHKDRERRRSHASDLRNVGFTLWIERDSDLDSIHEDPAYIELMKGR